MFHFKKSVSRRDAKMLFGRWAVIMERDDSQRPLVTESDIKKFLLTAGFVETSAFVLDGLADLIVKNTEDRHFKIGKEYERLTYRKSSGDSFRQQLAADIKNNIERVAKNIYTKYGCDIGGYRGNKNFIKVISIVYRVFVLK